MSTSSSTITDADISSPSASTPTYLARDSYCKKRQINRRSGDGATTESPIVGKMTVTVRNKNNLFYTIPADIFSLIVVVRKDGSAHKYFHCPLEGARSVQVVCLPPKLSDITRNELQSNKHAGYLSDFYFDTNDEVTPENAKDQIEVPRNKALSLYLSTEEILNDVDFMVPFRKAIHPLVEAKIQPSAHPLHLFKGPSPRVLNNKRTDQILDPQPVHYDLSPKTDGVKLGQFKSLLQPILAEFHEHAHSDSGTLPSIPPSDPPASGPGLDAPGSKQQGNDGKGGERGATSASSDGQGNQQGAGGATDSSASLTVRSLEPETCLLEVKMVAQPNRVFSTLSDVLNFYDSYFENYREDPNPSKSLSGFDFLLVRALNATRTAWVDLVEDMARLDATEIIAFALLIDFYLVADPGRQEKSEERLVVHVLRNLHERCHNTESSLNTNLETSAKIPFPSMADMRDAVADIIINVEHNMAIRAVAISQWVVDYAKIIEKNFSVIADHAFGYYGVEPTIRLSFYGSVGICGLFSKEICPKRKGLPPDLKLDDGTVLKFESFEIECDVGDGKEGELSKIVCKDGTEAVLMNVEEGLAKPTSGKPRHKRRYVYKAPMCKKAPCGNHTRDASGLCYCHRGILLVNESRADNMKERGC